MREIKKIKVLSLAKITAATYGLAGFFVALLGAISAIINIISQGDFSDSVSMVTLFNLGAGLLVGLVIAAAAAIVGFFTGLIAAYFYNIFARRFGGVEVELGERETPEIKN